MNAVLAYLAQRRGESVPRETLRGLLWGDSTEEQARASLRQALSSLRKSVGETGAAQLVFERENVRIAVEGFQCDVRDFEQRAKSNDLDDLEGAARLYRGDFLEGFGAVASEFDRWAETERSALRSRFLALLLRLADTYGTANRMEDMLATLHRLLEADPLQEHVHRRLIKALHQQKRYDAALKQFDALKQVLSDELGVQPERGTIDLVREIRAKRSQNPAPPQQLPSKRAQSTPDGSPAPGVLMPPLKPSIAVLPFRSLSEDDEAAFFGEGVAEDVMIMLSREAGLMVVSRQSSFKFDDRSETPQEIGHKLGVRFLLSGSVRRSGQRVRVSAHLTHCGTGEQTWADRYDRNLDDVFEIQDEIARTVAGTVIGRIEDAEVESSSGRPTESLEGYLLILRGKRHMQTPAPESFRQAIDCFQRATEISPKSGRAWGLLAAATMYARWYFEMETFVGDIIELGYRAIELEPRDAKAHCALGVAHMISREFEKAGHHFEAAISANPSDDYVLIEYGRFLMYTDRAEDGIRRIREAMRLNPYHPNWYWNLLGRCLHTLGRFDEALEVFNRVHTPPFYVWAYIAACHAELGNPEGCERARAKVLEQRPEFTLEDFKRAFPYQNEESFERYWQGFRLAGFAA